MLQQGQPVQGRQALGNDVLVRRKVLVGQGFPVREAEYGQILMPRQVIAQLPQQPLGRFGVFANDEQGTFGPAGGRRERQAVRGILPDGPIAGPAGAGGQGRIEDFSHERSAYWLAAYAKGRGL